MTIAVLSLGSLAADPTSKLDDPLLPIEFAKTSPQEGLILVLCDWTWGLYVQTPWVMSTLNDLQQARQVLAAQENVDIDEIGYIKMNANSPNPEHLYPPHDNTLRDVMIQQLRPWGQANHFDAVIWRDSDANAPFLNEQTLEDARTRAVKYLQELEGDNATRAAKYFRRVPKQVGTAIRTSIVVQLGWMPISAAPPITTGDELRLKDWQECRNTIGRLDSTLEDLRKLGFSLITGLLTASAFLGFSLSVPSPNVRAAVFIAIMVLVAALFSVDIYYQILLSGAVERALDLEVQTDPPIRVTKYISFNATKSLVTYITFSLYLVLLATAEGLGLSAATTQLKLVLPWSSGIPIWGLLVSIGGIFTVSMIVFIPAYVFDLIKAHKAHPTWPDKLPMVIAGILVLITVDVGILLWVSVVTNSLTLQLWFDVVGSLLALYIILYWLYATWQSNLHRQKPSREWPEGDEKVAAP